MPLLSVDGGIVPWLPPLWLRPPQPRNSFVDFEDFACLSSNRNGTRGKKSATPEYNN